MPVSLNSLELAARLGCPDCSARRPKQTSANKGKSDEIAVGSELGGRNFFCPHKFGRMRNQQAFKIMLIEEATTKRRREMIDARKSSNPVKHI